LNLDLLVKYYFTDFVHDLDQIVLGPDQNVSAA